MIIKLKLIIVHDKLPFSQVGIDRKGELLQAFVTGIRL